MRRLKRYACTCYCDITWRVALLPARICTYGASLRIASKRTVRLANAASCNAAQAKSIRHARSFWSAGSQRIGSKLGRPCACAEAATLAKPLPSVSSQRSNQVACTPAPLRCEPRTKNQPPGKVAWRRAAVCLLALSVAQLKLSHAHDRVQCTPATHDVSTPTSMLFWPNSSVWSWSVSGQHPRQRMGHPCYGPRRISLPRLLHTPAAAGLHNPRSHKPVHAFYRLPRIPKEPWDCRRL